MNADELNWWNDMIKQDTLSPVGNLGGEVVYTIFMSDFLRMPDLNFGEIIVMDAQMRALLN